MQINSINTYKISSKSSRGHFVFNSIKKDLTKLRYIPEGFLKPEKTGSYEDFMRQFLKFYPQKSLKDFIKIIKSKVVSYFYIGIGTSTYYNVSTTNKYIYGITPGDNIEDYIKVNNGSFELVANSLGKTNGTGATVKVKNSSGTVVDTYTIIIFGDVNGDGEITVADGNTVAAVSLGGEIEEATKVFAANVNGDDSITATDANTIKAASLGGLITTNPYAK